MKNSRTTLQPMPATSQELVELVDRRTLDVTVWQRLLLAVAAADPVERAGLPDGVGGLNCLAAAMAGVRRALAAAQSALSSDATADDLRGVSAADRRLAYGRWLVVRDVSADAERMLDLLRGTLGRYPALSDLDATQRSARAAVLDRTPDTYAAVFLRPAYARNPLKAPLTAAQRFELTVFVQSLRRDRSDAMTEMLGLLIPAAAEPNRGGPVPRSA